MIGNTKIVLAAHPTGEIRDEDFALQKMDTVPPKEGEALLETIFLSIDPYMRNRMNDQRTHPNAVSIGETMVGGAVSQVLESCSPELHPGQLVIGDTGWQSHPTVPVSALRVVDPSVAPISAFLGVLGMPGLTAYGGMTLIGSPAAGETVVVSAASGAVGSLASQIGKLAQCRVVGIAGGTAKCEYARGELGLDDCIDYRAQDFATALADACPNGVDVYFDNVGGSVFETVFGLLNEGARVPVCGAIAYYNGDGHEQGCNPLPNILRNLITKRITLRGFMAADFEADRERFMSVVAGWVKDGRIRYREDVSKGLASAPSVLRGVLQGRNFGKAIVQVREWQP
ncbi:MAG: NADP-dependent oxidoreductase [Mesorhizobium sp.]|uniref:NADP-dependent oxidoreductase n=1 Tax=Mesorhizobium sp. TaxID=1871066 RepID=UPI000FE9B2CD|nr:NADP-dependent oxidoreductase [Mesorhizobium sp.]RWI54735.1 MAG: NADP-dependent oxidoreductase [Mesorhizobium sp.]